MRQAKGLTQKQLGDMLYVSNKTVSRWERDECMPDLALIPAIAEIFGITSDELLRGERNNAENADNTPSNLLGKGEKRALVMVERRLKHFSMLTAIPAVLSFAGLTTAVLLNLLLYEGLIGFFVAAGCCLGSAIIEVCLAITYSLRRTEEFAAIAARVRAVQNIITRTDAGIIAADICIVAFCTPLAAYLTGGGMRLAAESWLTSGLEITCCTGAVIFAVYGVFIRPALTGRGALYFSPERAAQRETYRKILAKTAFVGGIIFVSAAIAAIICLFAYPDGDYSDIPHLCMFADCIICAAVYNAIIFIRSCIAKRKEGRQKRAESKNKNKNNNNKNKNNNNNKIN